MRERNIQAWLGRPDASIPSLPLSFVLLRGKLGDSENESPLRMHPNHLGFLAGSKGNQPGWDEQKSFMRSLENAAGKVGGKQGGER